MHLQKARSAIAILLGLSVVLLQPLTAAAAPTNNATAPVTDTSTLKISPVRSDIQIAPGTVGKVAVYVSNITPNTMILQAIENDFISGDENGTPSILLDQNSYAPTHSLKRFMIPIPNVTVPANSTKEVDVQITVPSTAQAGGYFGAIRFAPASVDGSKSVNIGTSVASLILMTVPGPTTEQLLLTNFDVQQNGGTATNFRTPNNLSLLVRFQNKGNVQLAPFGQIFVQKGKKTVYTYDFNDTLPRQEILPDGARRWNVPLKGFSKFGKYTVNATFGYGTKGENIEITKTVWIIPTVFILTILGIVVFLAVVIIGGWTFLKSYKRKILRSSRRRY